MNDPEHRALESRVREQYERFPFPDHSKSRAVISALANSDDPARLSGSLFGGRADPSTWSILIAGGGTGEKTLGLAMLTRHFGTRIVHLDLSGRSIEVAEGFCRARGVDNVEFVQGSIHDIPSLLPGRRFDYVQCMGVLHHLPDPQAGLDRLAGVLTDGGALSLAVYADVGRTAVYLAREAMGVLTDGVASLDETVAIARSAMERLPKSNWLRSDPAMMLHIGRHGDNALLDAILHARDVAYDAYSFRALLDGSGLVFADHCEPFQKMVYDVRGYRFPADLRRRVEALPELARKRFLELFHGRLVVQSAYASRGAAHRAPFVDDMIPHRTIFTNIRWTLDTEGRVELRDTRFGGLRMQVGGAATFFLLSVNEVRTNGEIFDLMIAKQPAFGDRDTLRQRLEKELEPLFHYDLISLCDRPFRAAT